MEIPLCAATVIDRNFPTDCLITRLPSEGTKEFILGSLAEVQLRRSREAVQSSGSIHFNHEIMLQGPRITRDRLEEYVDKFAGEHFFHATHTPVYFDGQNWFHQDGERYADFFERGIEYYTHSEKLKNRFTAEGLGYANAQVIVRHYLDEGLPPPKMVINSPPADVYSNAAFVPRDVYFLLIPVRERSLVLGEGSSKSYWEFQLLTVPHHSTSTRDQWKRTLPSVDLETSLTILQMSLDHVRENDPNWIVSTPLILENIALLSSDLGYESFDHLESEARNSLRLHEDPLALMRRREMVAYFTDTMWHSLKRRTELTHQDKQKLKLATDMMHLYLSAEGGGEYIGMTFEAVKKLIEGHTHVEYRKSGVTFTSEELLGINWAYAEAVYSDYYFRLQHNPATQERLANAGCPVAVNEQLTSTQFEGVDSIVQTYEYDPFLYAGLDILQNYGYTPHVTGFFDNSLRKEDKEVKVKMNCGLCCSNNVVRHGEYYVCKSCHGSIECSKIPQPVGE